jgi:LacI family transcriptional regulator
LRAAEKLGYRLEEFRVNRDFTPKRLHQVLNTRAIRGILLPPHAEPPVWEDFPWDHYSVVRYGRSIPEPPFHVVTAAQVLNTILAFRKIRELGYERIGFVDCREATVKPGHLFLAGFLGAQTALDESQRIPVLNLSLTPDPGRHKNVAKWVKKHRVEAILTSFSELPRILKEANLRVPQDVALAGTTTFDTSISAGIDQHPEEIGRVGLLLLNSLINDRETGLPQIYRQSLVEGSWIDGPSLPPLSRASSE